MRETQNRACRAAAMHAGLLRLQWAEKLVSSNGKNAKVVCQGGFLFLYEA